MKLSFDSLDLELTLAERAQSTVPYEDWCRIVVGVRVPGFSGKFEWSATLGDLRNLQAAFRQLHEKVGTEIELTFEPTEPNIAFVFRSDRLGHVDVEYVFNSILAYGPRLAGSFGLDQSYLPTLVKEFEQLVVAAAAA